MFNYRCKGEFFVARGSGAGSKVPDAVLRCFSTNLDSKNGKSCESLVNNRKPLKRRGLRRPASSPGQANEAAAADLPWRAGPFAVSHERRNNREFSRPKQGLFRSEQGNFLLGTGEFFAVKWGTFGPAWDMRFAAPWPGG
jgi:hypothetical protein